MIFSPSARRAQWDERSPGWLASGRLRRLVVALCVPAALLAAVAVGWSSGRGAGLMPLALALVIPILIVGPRLRPEHWIVVWLGVAGLLAWAPGVSPGGLPEVNAERVALVLVVSFALWRCLYASAGAWIWPLLFSVDYLLMAAFESPNVRDAMLSFVRHYATAFALFVIAAGSLGSAQSRGLFFRAVPLIGGFLALVALVQPVLNWNFGVDANVWTYRLSGTLESPPVLGAALAALLILSLFELLNGTPRWRMVSVVACALMAAAILLTFTRAAWLSVLVGLVVLGVANLRRRPVVASLLLACVLVAMVFGGSVVDALNDDPRLRDEANAVGRLATSELSFQLFMQRPLVGWGPLTLTLFTSSASYGDWVSHDSFLTLLDATGLLGTVLYFGPIAFAVGTGVKRLVRDPSPLSSPEAYALAGASVYVVNALAIDMRYFAYPHALFWLCLGLLLARRRAPPDAQDGPAIRTALRHG